MRLETSNNIAPETDREGDEQAPNSDPENSDSVEDSELAEHGIIRYPKLKVSIRHESIADFLKGPDHDAHSLIHVNQDSAQVHILRTCLRVYCDNELFVTCCFSDGLMRYAEFIAKHLCQLNLANISKEDKLDLATLLQQLFSSKVIMHRWVSWNPQVLFQYLEEFAAAVQRLLKDPDLCDVQETSVPHSPQFVQWRDSISTASVEEVLRPFALGCATNWLQVDNWNCDYEISFLRRYLQMASLKDRYFTKIF